MNYFRYDRTYRGPLQAILFDWAGTTVDYGCMAPTQVFMEVFRRQGVELTVTQAREPMGTHKIDHLREISQMVEVSRQWQQVHGKPCTEDDVAAMYQEFVPLQVDCIAKFADLIPGTAETIDTCRRRGLKIGATTGYSREMMTVLEKEADRRGYCPDSTISATDVPAGRPEPWMCFANAQNLRVFPNEAIVKVGDTLPDIAEGLNAGMWTIGVVKTGNEFGLSEAQVCKLTAEQFGRLQQRAYRRMYQVGAHYVVDEIGDIFSCLDDIEDRLEAGERP